MIEISVENTPRLAEAVDTLRQQAERARPVTALPTAEGSLACARKAFGHALDQWVRAWELTRDPVGRDSILRELEQSRAALLVFPRSA